MAIDIAQLFYAQIEARDADSLAGLANQSAEFECMALGVGGPARQACVRYWRDMLAGFPDLSIELRKTWLDELGTTAFVDAVVSGTQAEDVFRIRCAGRAFASRQLHVFEVNGGGLLKRLTLFWDRMSWELQLSARH
ncbi:MAG: nuclear transport factor 2 family protein [Pseudomonadota bacterium]